MRFWIKKRERQITVERHTHKGTKVKVSTFKYEPSKGIHTYRYRLVQNPWESIVVTIKEKQ